MTRPRRRHEDVSWVRLTVRLIPAEARQLEKLAGIRRGKRGPNGETLSDWVRAQLGLEKRPRRGSPMRRT